VGLSVIVPVYNEARRLRDTLPRLHEYVAGLGEPGEIIVVNDGSTDDTAQVVMDLARSYKELRLIHRDRNRGKGASVRRGVLAAREAHVLFTDAGLSAPIEEAAKLRAKLAEGCQVAIGSRRLPGSDVQVRQSWFQRLAGRVLSTLVRLLFLRGITDSQCGFKAFERGAAEAIFKRQQLDGFGFDVEVLWLARRLGYQVAEVPIVWRDDPESHIRPFRDAARMLGELVRFRLNAWRGRYDLRGGP